MSSQPVLYYFSLGRLGRGEVNRLFMRELGIDFKDELYDYPTWSEQKADEADLNLTGKLPVLDIDGHRLSQVRKIPLPLLASRFSLLARVCILGRIATDLCRKSTFPSCGT